MQEESDKSKAKDGKDTAKAEMSSEYESWKVIVEADKAPSQGEPYDTQSALSASIALTKSETELYDSGASRHISPFQHRFSNLRSIPPRPIIVANNHVFYATGMGDLRVDVPNGSLSTHITLKDALYTPDMTSIAKLLVLATLSVSRAKNARSRTKMVKR